MIIKHRLNGSYNAYLYEFAAQIRGVTIFLFGIGFVILLNLDPFFFFFFIQYDLGLLIC
jgi:hypothetical protein